MTARFNCPLCEWFHDDPGPNPESTDPMALAGVFGPGVFAAHAMASHAQKIEEILTTHFKTHTTVEWLRKVTALQAEVAALRKLLDEAGDWVEYSNPADPNDLSERIKAALSADRFTDGHGNNITHLVGEKR